MRATAKDLTQRTPSKSGEHRERERFNAEGAEVGAQSSQRKQKQGSEPRRNSRGSSSDAFDYGGYALAYAYAHGAEGVTAFGGLELVHGGGDQADAAGA